jgi:hypothetical protein
MNTSKSYSRQASGQPYDVGDDGPGQPKGAKFTPRALNLNPTYDPPE